MFPKVLIYHVSKSISEFLLFDEGFYGLTNLKGAKLGEQRLQLLGINVTTSF